VTILSFMPSRFFNRIGAAVTPCPPPGAPTISSRSNRSATPETPDAAPTNITR
jgi:hypothetical protein